MDQSTLVAEVIEDGRKLVAALIAAGISVERAFWLQASEEDFWFLYIVTDLADQGPAVVYQRIYAIYRQLNLQWLDVSAIKAIRPSSQIAQDVGALVARRGDRLPTRVGSTTLGSIPIDHGYIYPASTFTPA